MPRILSLNDWDMILGFLDHFLNERGYEHLYTTDSHHALSILRQQPIDLFIQDLLRTDMNGFALYWLMKSEERLRDVPILICSLWNSAKVKVTPVTVAGRTLQGLFRAELEGVQPKDLIAVGRIRHANVLYVEGYLRPFIISELLDNIERILKSQSLLTEEERAIRHQHLWSQSM
jgi:CheY-like chemotaxis protein